jgi:hypothetical protein
LRSKSLRRLWLQKEFLRHYLLHFVEGHGCSGEFNTGLGFFALDWHVVLFALLVDPLYPDRLIFQKLEDRFFAQGLRLI